MRLDRLQTGRSRSCLGRASPRSRSDRSRCRLSYVTTEDRELTGILLLYSVTAFTGATLLFAIQPMVGKMILPLLGGTPAVWNTCMVFFQAALLGGYAYAHATSAWFGVRRQAALHLAVLTLPFAVLPLTIQSRGFGDDAYPVASVLLLLAGSVGLPFLVVSATAPLLQRWFAETGHPAAHDPYFLYAASNLGSMLALLSYPTLIEPRLELRGDGWLTQTRLWSVGYAGLVTLTLACAVAVWRTVSSCAIRDEDVAVELCLPSSEQEREAASLRWRLRWVALAFVPSSLLLGATTYITTDIAAVPLLWVLPLAAYLLSFIIAFGHWPASLQRIAVAAAIPVIVLDLLALMSTPQLRIWVTVLWHLFALLVVALACHGELAHTRPPPSGLTAFYLWISLGGVLGGLFNAIVAPLAFTSLVEYPLAMVLGAVLLTSRHAAGGGRHMPIAALAGAGALVISALVLYSQTLTLRIDFAFLARVFDLYGSRLMEWLIWLERNANKVLVWGLPLGGSLFLRRRPLALGVALAGLLGVAAYVDARNNDQIRQVRSFFGVLHISRDRDEKGYTELRHGTTLHGRQSLEPERRGEPLSYYYRGGPIGQIFVELDRRALAHRTAVIGLGTGTLAAYARTGDAMTFYEIDPLVRDIALDPAYFTYLADAEKRGASVRIDLGDARLRLQRVKSERPGERYDLIVVDAFTSDAIPVHLLTREAVQLYFEMLRPKGLLAFHISNRFLRLEPVVANLAEDANVSGLLGLDDSAEPRGAANSSWAALARTPEALGALARDQRWTPIEHSVDHRVGTWTDNASDLVSILKW